MKWYIPREHGAWAMLIVPYWVGAFISDVQWIHLFLFIGLFSIYFAQAPLLTYIRNPKHKDVWPSFFIYVAIGSLFIIPSFILEPYLIFIALLILPLFMVNLYFAKTKRERLFINDLVAIIALSSLLFMAYRLTEANLSIEVFVYFLKCILFFTASVFHVKSLIREKFNLRFHKQSKIYHIVITLVAVLFQWYGAAIAFLVSLVKTLFLPKKYLRKPMHIGIVEIMNSVIFFVLVIML